MRRLLVAMSFLTYGCTAPKIPCDGKLHVTSYPTISGVCADGRAVRVKCEYADGCAFTVPCELASLTARHGIETIEREAPLPRNFCVYRSNE